MDTDGSILVSNTQSNKVERYNATTGALIGTVAANGTGNGQVKKPGGLLVTGTGQSRRLWIADVANNRVTVLNSTGAVEKSFGSVGAGLDQFNLPQGVAVDPTDGDIAVADFDNNRISLWEPQGAPPVDTANPTAAFTAPASGASLPAGTVAVAGHQLRRHLGGGGRRAGAAVLGQPVAAGQRHHLGRQPGLGVRDPRGAGWDQLDLDLLGPGHGGGHLLDDRPGDRPGEQDRSRRHVRSSWPRHRTPPHRTRRSRRRPTKAR